MAFPCSETASCSPAAAKRNIELLLKGFEQKTRAIEI